MTSYNHAEVRRLYRTIDAAAYDDNTERMRHAQRIESINRTGRINRHVYARLRSGWPDGCDCMWASRHWVATYDDWGQGPMCVMCGEIREVCDDVL